MNQSSDNEITSSNSNTPEKKKGLSVTAIREMYSGPLPPPEMLAKYEQIQKGSASRIIKMAEKQSDHRQKMENTVIGSNIWNERIGMFLAFCITTSIIVGGVYLIRSDKDIAGFTVLASGVGIQFYNYYNQQRKEQIKKDEKGRNNNIQKIQS